ncbi:Type I Iterative PKS [Pestalotiopsis sp. IQ-011]
MTRSEKFALVTGCGRGGIGESLVAEYKRQGVQPIATVLPHENSDHLSEAGITTFPLDVTVEQSVADLQVRIQELTGGYLDILVNCAGIAYTMTAIDTDIGAVQRMFDINLFGPMRMVRSFHDMIIRAKGTIVNIGSIGGIIPFIYGSSYNASKAALHHWGNSLRVELAPFDVKVITVISGEVSTNILKNDSHRTLPEGL